MTTPSSISERHRRHGFTLVELLVTITIIAVLAGISFTAFRSIRAKANESTSASNMRQIGIAIQTFVADKGRYPGNLPGTDEYQIPWDRVILNNLGDPNFDFKEGKSNPIRKDTPAFAALGSAAEILYCPGDKAKAPSGMLRRSYAICPWTASDKDPKTPSQWDNGFSGLLAGTGAPASRVTDPSRAVVLVEFQTIGGSGYQNLIGAAYYERLFGYEQRLGPANYHGKNQLLLFVDGHVDKCPGNINAIEWNSKGYSPHVRTK